MSQEKTDPLYALRHSCAHLLAWAVLDYFGSKVKFAIGPVIENGFYYDFNLPREIKPEDLPALEKLMKEKIRGHHAFRGEQVTPDEARRRSADQPYKLELIHDLAEEKSPISYYTVGDFADLCRGHHTENTQEINPEGIKLTHTAGAYWRGSENNPMLTRIYGLAFDTKEKLETHSRLLEEARKRDHRKLGSELEIFVFDEEVGPGLPLWLPNGGELIEQLEQLAKEVEQRAGYVRVRTPHLTKESLFLKSGHLPYYADSMYPPMELEGVRYYIKPMNCPFHHKIFSSKPRSYRDLPLRVAEYGTCYRYEKSGELFGLLRARSLEMNDAHIYISREMFEREFMNVINLYLEYFKLFGIERYVMRLSTHDPKELGKKYVDNAELWNETEELVRGAMKNGNVDFVEVPGEAAFYGPKIDVQIWSAIGKEFTLATNQVDFSQPLRFDLKFTNSHGKYEMPLVIHRAPLSTHERMIGFLIEHYAGAFRLWLSPVQVDLLVVSEKYLDAAKKLVQEFRQQTIRVFMDESNESVGKNS